MFQSRDWNNKLSSTFFPALTGANYGYPLHGAFGCCHLRPCQPLRRHGPQGPMHSHRPQVPDCAGGDRTETNMSQSSAADRAVHAFAFRVEVGRAQGAPGKAYTFGPMQVQRPCSTSKTRALLSRMERARTRRDSCNGPASNHLFRF